MLSKEQKMQVAQNIMTQLGSGRFRAMTGAKEIYALDSGVQFRLPSRFAKDGINKVQIVLTPADDYSVEFGKAWGSKYKCVAKVDGVYADMLQQVFKANTGLDTHL